MPNSIWNQINKRVFIIAEIGKNFIQTQEEGSVEEYLENAKKLVDEAAEAGADAVKFQTHIVEDEQLNINVTSPHFKGSDRYNWVKRNTEVTPVEGFWKPLKEYCDKKGVIFFSTPMSRGAAKILNEEVGVELWKVGSGDILDFVMLDYLRGTGKPIIVSSGMSTLEEVEMAIGFLDNKVRLPRPLADLPAGRQARGLAMTEGLRLPRPEDGARNDGGVKIVLLHCVSKYPCPPEDLRLGTMDVLREKFGLLIGFSDHSIGVESSVVAAAMGARMLEKHFSLSRDLWGSDHKVSMTPAELKELVLAVRRVEGDPAERKRVLGTEFARRAIGFLDNKVRLPRVDQDIDPRNDGGGTMRKVLQDGEAVFRPLFRKSLMAGRDIKAGEVIVPEMLFAMRPQEYAGGLPSEEYEKVLGKKVKKDMKKFEAITKEILG